MGPGPRPYAGGDQQPVEPDLFAVGKLNLLAGQVQPGRGYAEPPVRIEVDRRRQGGALRRHPPIEDLLGQRRPVIGFIRFVTDQRQRAREALTPQRCRSSQTCQRRAYDDNTAGPPEALSDPVTTVSRTRRM